MKSKGKSQIATDKNVSSTSTLSVRGSSFFSSTATRCDLEHIPPHPGLAPTSTQRKGIALDRSEAPHPPLSEDL